MGSGHQNPLQGSLEFLEGSVPVSVPQGISPNFRLTTNCCSVLDSSGHEGSEGEHSLHRGPPGSHWAISSPPHTLLHTNRTQKCRLLVPRPHPMPLPLLNLSCEASAFSAFPLSAGSHPSEQWPAKRRAVDSDPASLCCAPWHSMAPHSLPE